MYQKAAVPKAAIAAATTAAGTLSKALMRARQIKIAGAPCQTRNRGQKVHAHMSARIGERLRLLDLRTRRLASPLGGGPLTWASVRECPLSQTSDIPGCWPRQRWLDVLTKHHGVPYRHLYG